jgi:transposase
LWIDLSGHAVSFSCDKHLHLAIDNDPSRTSKRIERYVQDCGGRLCLHSLPPWSPQTNPVELVWWGLHEAVSRNHRCERLSELVEFAEGYLQDRQPFRLELGEDCKHLERAPP